MAIPTINLSQYPRQGSPQENILETGNVERVIRDIDSGHEEKDVTTLRRELSQLMHLMCQARNSNASFANKCNSLLSKRFIELLTTYDAASIIAKEILSNESLTELAQLKEVAEMVENLSKPRFRQGVHLLNTGSTYQLSHYKGKILALILGTASIGLGVPFLLRNYPELIQWIILEGPAKREDPTLPYFTIGFVLLSIPMISMYLSVIIASFQQRR